MSLLSVGPLGDWQRLSRRWYGARRRWITIRGAPLPLFSVWDEGDRVFGWSEVSARILPPAAPDVPDEPVGVSPVGARTPGEFPGASVAWETRQELASISPEGCRNFVGRESLQPPWERQEFDP